MAYTGNYNTVQLIYKLRCFIITFMWIKGNGTEPKMTKITNDIKRVTYSLKQQIYVYTLCQDLNRLGSFINQKQSKTYY